MSANSGVNLSLSGHVAVITGGSRGIGAATVKMFAAAGAKVVFSYQRAQAEAEAVAAACGGPRECVPVQVDLTGVAGAKELVDVAVHRFGRCDLLVANHGIWRSADVPVDQMSDEQWRTTLAINLDSVFSLVRHAVAQMKKQGVTERTWDREREMPEFRAK